MIFQDKMRYFFQKQNICNFLRSASHKWGDKKEKSWKYTLSRKIYMHPEKLKQNHKTCHECNLTRDMLMIKILRSTRQG